MAVNEVIYDGETLISLANDTVTENDLPEGVTAHDASGEQITGTARYVRSVNNITPDDKGDVVYPQVDWAQTNTTQSDYIKNKPDVATKAYVQEQIAKFDFIKVVDELPQSGLINKIYLVPKASGDQATSDLFDEYIWVEDATKSSGGYWEWITTKQLEVDLTNYITTTMLNNAILARSKLEHPVGSFYISTASTNPNSIFGFGTWTLIKDRFLIGAGNSYSAKGTGGAATVTLTNAQIPRVTGSITMHGGEAGTNIGSVGGCFSPAITTQKYMPTHNLTAGATSVGQINFSNNGSG